MIHGITFSTPDMMISGLKCTESMKKFGVDGLTSHRGCASIATDFYESNKTIFEQSRGYGYWLWKPYFILEKLNGCTFPHIEQNDFLIYSDAGVEFISSIQPIIDIMNQTAQDIFLFGNKWLHNNWCKGDVMYSINQNFCEGAKQAQASVIFIKNTQKARDFIKTWLCYCMMPGMIDDSPSKFPNHPNFQEHRHDQAILCSLAIREGIKLHWWPASYNNGQFIYDKDGYADEGYPVIFSHHRRRNNEY